MKAHGIQRSAHTSYSRCTDTRLCKHLTLKKILSTWDDGKFPHRDVYTRQMGGEMNSSCKNKFAQQRITVLDHITGSVNTLE